MTLALTSHDEERIAHTCRTLLSPLAHKDVPEWRRHVHRALNELVGADLVGSVFATPGAPIGFCDELASGVVDAYPGRIEPLNARSAFWDRSAHLGVFTRAMVWASCLDEYYRSE